MVPRGWKLLTVVPKALRPSSNSSVSLQSPYWSNQGAGVGCVCGFMCLWLAHLREVEVRLIDDSVPGRVWSQTITPDTPQEARWQLQRVWSHSSQCTHRSTTVCHTPLACSQCHPLTQPSSHMYGRGYWTRAASSRLTDWEPFVLIHILEITALNTGES